MDALDIELDAPDAVLCGPFLFDQLQPLVVDSPRLQVCRGQPWAAAKIVVAGEAGLGEDSMHRATAPAAVGRKGVCHQRLRAMNAARHRRQGLPRRSIAGGWLRGGHGEGES
jgi:hypothetical protein